MNDCNELRDLLLRAMRAHFLSRLKRKKKRRAPKRRKERQKEDNGAKKRKRAPKMREKSAKKEKRAPKKEKRAQTKVCQTLLDLFFLYVDQIRMQIKRKLLNALIKYKQYIIVYSNRSIKKILKNIFNDAKFLNI